MMQDVSELIKNAINHYMESGKPGVPSLDASGVTRTKVQIRNDEGELLEEIEKEAFSDSVKTLVKHTPNYARRSLYALILSLPFFVGIYGYWRDGSRFMWWVKQITMNHGKETSIYRRTVTASNEEQTSRSNVDPNNLICIYSVNDSGESKKYSLPITLSPSDNSGIINYSDQPAHVNAVFGADKIFLTSRNELNPNQKRYTDITINRKDLSFKMMRAQYAYLAQGFLRSYYNGSCSIIKNIQNNNRV